MTNEETLEAIREVEEMKENLKEYPSYKNIDTMMEELLK